MEKIRAYTDSFWNVETNISGEQITTLLFYRPALPESESCI
jgi:hypothetical protein